MIMNKYPYNVYFRHICGHVKQHTFYHHRQLQDQVQHSQDLCPVCQAQKDVTPKKKKKRGQLFLLFKEIFIIFFILVLLLFLLIFGLGAFVVYMENQ